MSLAKILACIGLLAACASSDHAALDDLEAATAGLQACLVHREESRECEGKRESFELARLECDKLGITERQIEAAEELGRRGVVGDPGNSPYATQLKKVQEKLATERHRLSNTASALRAHEASLRSRDWAAFIQGPEMRRFDTRDCPASFHADEYTYRFFAEYLFHKDTKVLKGTNSAFLPRGRDLEGAQRHLFFVKLKPGDCYSSSTGYPIIELTDPKALHGKYWKPEIDELKAHSIRAGWGRYFNLHVCGSDDECNELFGEIKSKARRFFEVRNRRDEMDRGIRNCEKKLEEMPVRLRDLESLPRTTRQVRRESLERNRERCETTMSEQVPIRNELEKEMQQLANVLIAPSPPTLH